MPLRLHHRIVVPFVLVSLLTASVAALVSLTVASRTLQSRTREQLSSAAAVISRSDLALNPSILRSVRDIARAEVITFGSHGEVLATTLDRTQHAALIERVIRAALARPATNSSGGPFLDMDCGTPCLVAVRRLESRPDVSIALVADTSELTAATRAITRAIVGTAALSILVMVLVTQVVARRVTAPIDRLVKFVRELGPRGTQRRAHVGGDEIGRLATAFNEMLDRLEASQGALIQSEKLALAGLLAARVAHDIRNPLSSIKMQTQLLRARLVGDAEQEGAARAVLHDIDQVESVIRDLLELARPGELKLRPSQLNAVVSDVLTQMGPQLAYRKISVDLALDEQLPVISLDVDRMKQALVNLMANAADSMATGGRLAIATRGDAQAATVTLEICDEGAGIPPEMLEKVFDPFVSTKRDGVGLGLVNARAVVENHGGRITLHRRESKGTCARIVLPVAGRSTAEPRHG